MLAPAPNVSLIRSIMAARVVDLPEPVGPVTSTSPRGFFASDELDMRPQRRAPLAGEHTSAILQDDLGCDPAAIDALIRTGVVR